MNSSSNFFTAPVVKAVTTYDLLKTVMVVVMIIDHIGFFFLPDWPVLRAVGRLGAPAWFFLAGYSVRAGKSDWLLWVAAGIMLLGHWLIISGIWPLTVLLSIAVARFLIIRVPRMTQLSVVPATALALGLMMLTALTYERVEYGAYALLFGLWGWITRHSAAERSWMVYPLLGIPFFIVQQWHMFGFDVVNGIIMAAGTLAMAAWLWRFRPQPLQAAFAAPLLHFCGRQTLLIYVVHFLTFALIANATVPQ